MGMSKINVSSECKNNMEAVICPDIPSRSTLYHRRSSQPGLLAKKAEPGFMEMVCGEQVH
jgi:hypothetical protein